MCYESENPAKNEKYHFIIFYKYNKMYKITGEIYSDKEKAKKALAELPENIDAFVTAVYK